MAVGAWPGVDRFYAAAAQFVDHCLRRDGSLFTPERPIWSRAVADELAPRLLERQGGSESFGDKLETQVAGLSDEAKQLSAELVYVQLLPVADMSAASKRERVERALAELSRDVSIPDELLAAFNPGFASYGAARAQAPNQVRFLMRFTQAWKHLSEAEQTETLHDPWAFKRWLTPLDRHGAQTQFEALLHIVHPDAFESIVSQTVKKRIVAAYQTLLDGQGAGDEDRALLDVRRHLEPLVGVEFSHYDPGLQGIWSETTDSWREFVHWSRRLYEVPEFDATERDYKLEVAAKLAAAKDALNGDDWLEHLRPAFGSPNNLTNWREHDPFFVWCAANPDAAREMLAQLWSTSAMAEMRGALNRIPTDVVRGRAARASLASFLLGAVDISSFPFFRMTVYEKAAKLVSRPTVSPEETVAELYQDFLAFLDELRVRLLVAGTETRDRLDAQSLAWWVTSADPPTSWGGSERAAFRAFQEGTGAARHAWLVRGENAYGTNLVPRWLSEDFVSVGCSDEGDIHPGMSRSEIAAELQRKGGGDAPQYGPRADTGHRFLNLMAPRDLVMTVDGDAVYFGVIETEAESHPDGEPGMAHRRRVEWVNANSPLSRADLPPGVTRLMKQPTVIDMTAVAHELAALAGIDWDGDTPPPIGGVAPGSVVPTATTALAKSVYLPSSWLQDVIELLNEKGQVIFYGPPGTGKTYVAQELGKHVERAGGTWRLVQFHPAYSYEDFFEGYRPVQGSEQGGLSFILRHGPLREMAELAKASIEVPHVLVIDEINRGNLAKIFGELYFLLEYRDRVVRLQYSPDEEFSVPKNLYFIGTMNTADRSIALVDSALRRRFYFVPFVPREAPISGVLRAWLTEKRHDPEPARLLDELNRALAERGGPEDEFAIGPSYFMTKDGPPNLDRVWRHAILPLLEERFYAQQTREQIAAAFGLEAITARLHPSDAETDPAPMDEADEPATE